jgi:hypothetical protein
LIDERYANPDLFPLKPISLKTCSRQGDEIPGSESVRNLIFRMRNLILFVVRTQIDWIGFTISRHEELSFLYGHLAMRLVWANTQPFAFRPHPPPLEFLPSKKPNVLQGISKVI